MVLVGVWNDERWSGLFCPECGGVEVEVCLSRSRRRGDVVGWWRCGRVDDLNKLFCLGCCYVGYLWKFKRRV